jgi:hypothetical protein
MQPVSFEGATEIKKPSDMTDEECMSVWAKFGFGKLFEIIQAKQSGFNILIPGIIAGVDTQGFPYYLTAWKPSYEDLQALNKGEPIYIKTVSRSLPPMAVYTVDENGNCNDAG